MNHKYVRPFTFSVRLVALTALLGFGNLARAAWQLTWSDEFSGSQIDTNHWAFDLGNGPPGLTGWGNNELEYYTSRPENAYVSNGLLHLVARAENLGSQHYTSAKMNTRGRFSQACGRFEFRARLPQGKGYWPALWMMPAKGVYGRWAASGEIDVLENRGKDPTTVLGTIHFGGSYPKQTHSDGPSYHFPAGDSVTNFHTYAVEWSLNSIKWYVDTNLYQEQTNWWSAGGKHPAPFDQPFYIMMNLAVGGNFGGNPDTNTIFPGEMQVDYVRVYEQAPELVATPRPKKELGSGAVEPAVATTDSKKEITPISKVRLVDEKE